MTEQQLRIALGWFITAWEDKNYPAYSGPGDPFPAHNPRWDMIHELREQTGIDLTEHHKALAQEADTAIMANLPPLQCSPPACPDPQPIDLNEFRSRLSFPEDEAE